MLKISSFLARSLLWPEFFERLLGNIDLAIS
jgi:hypothetical protein